MKYLIYAACWPVVSIIVAALVICVISGAGDDAKNEEQFYD